MDFEYEFWKYLTWILKNTFCHGLLILYLWFIIFITALLKSFTVQILINKNLKLIQQSCHFMLYLPPETNMNSEFKINKTALHVLIFRDILYDISRSRTFQTIRVSFHSLSKK